MSEFESGIAINVLSSAIWFVLGAFGVKIYTIYKTRRTTLFNSFAQMPYSIELVHLTYGLVESDVATRSAQEGDIAAICSALLLLQERFGSKRVRVMGANAALSQFGVLAHLVSVSGPVWNSVTSKLLDSNPIPVKFATVGEVDVLVDEVNIPKQYKTRRESNIARECYAVVYRGSCETGEGISNSFVVAAGISALGTFGAVTWLRKCATLRLRQSRFVRQLKEHEHALAILRVRDKSPEGFQAYSAGPVSPGFLEIEVVSRYKVGHFPSNTRDVTSQDKRDGTVLQIQTYQG